MFSRVQAALRTPQGLLLALRLVRGYDNKDSAYCAEVGRNIIQWRQSVDADGEVSEVYL